MEETKRIPVLIFCENNFEEIVKVDATQVDGFRAGVQVGSGHYGAGSCATYVLPDDDAEMREWETDEEVERALAELACLNK